MTRLSAQAWVLLASGCLALWLPLAPALADDATGSQPGAAGPSSQTTTSGATTSQKSTSQKSTSQTGKSQPATDAHAPKSAGHSPRNKKADDPPKVDKRKPDEGKSERGTAPAGPIRPEKVVRAQTVRLRPTVPPVRLPNAMAVEQPQSPGVAALPASAMASQPSATTATSATTTAGATTATSATTTAGATTTAVKTARPSLINAIGSFVFNVIGGAMLAFAGPPALPRGSTVTVKVSSLTMPDTGQKVQANWYFPQNADTTTRMIYFQHGFMAVAPMYSYTLAALAQSTNSIVVAPTLSSNAFDPKARWLGGSADQQAVADLFAGDRSALTESASAAAGHQVTLPTSFVLVGHSLGGALVTGAAGRMVDNGAVANLQGVVLMDSVDLNNVVPTALQKLTGADYRPVYDISSEPYVWNRDGLVGRELEAARPGQFNGVMLVGGRHIDALQGANPVLQFAEYVVAGFSRSPNIEAEKTLAIGWINDMFAGTQTGIYGAPGQTITIDTKAGPATAVALPFASARPVQATPWDGLAQLILNTVLQFAVYEPMAQPSPARAVSAVLR
ncbi:alpha/beta hydrolase [Mycolicibacterium mucogenicum]|uniref:alpha/beta hydrolase n=1 Tax=Mycolicibacterium mucogenicum TaxID=56689 RepID=UPI0022699597|nr:alpha/beta hydrolase [Mycolicibacterium mucogenicum]MCX8556235.1 alpha/beta hydrolase [Mycolicibacterium mucogenicum]